MISRQSFFFTLSLHRLLISLLHIPPIRLPGINIFKRDTYASTIEYQSIGTMNPKTLELAQEWPTRKDKSENLRVWPGEKLSFQKMISSPGERFTTCQLNLQRNFNLRQ